MKPGFICILDILEIYLSSYAFISYSIFFMIDHDEEEVEKDDIVRRLQLFNPKSANVLEELDGLLKQESLMNECTTGSTNN